MTWGGEVGGPCNFQGMVDMFQNKMAGDGNDPDDLIIQAFSAYDNDGKIDVKMFQHAPMTWGDKMTKAEIDDIYPLNEVALISKKDPKRLVIDASSFPQATGNIMSAIREAGMNLSPQQDGLRIFVPIPKVNKEFREKLVVGARKKLNSSKDELRLVQNLYTKRMEESDPPPGVSKDDVKEAVTAVRLITESFIVAADQLLVIKSKELMGK